MSPNWWHYLLMSFGATALVLAVAWTLESWDHTHHPAPGLDPGPGDDVWRVLDEARKITVDAAREHGR